MDHRVLTVYTITEKEEKNIKVNSGGFGMTCIYTFMC